MRKRSGIKFVASVQKLNEQQAEVERVRRHRKMYHLLLTCCLIAIAFGVLTRRYPIEAIYLLLASFPTLIFIVGITDEYSRGIQQFNHQVLHLAYDSSYALLLLGIILVLRAILKRKLITRIVAGTCVAGIPLGYIFITHN